MITLKEVAQRCGCSIAAVSKALNGRPDINAETAKRIKRIAREMGYVPNTAARTLKTNSSRIIGLLFFLRDTTIWEHEYFSYIAASIQEVTEQNGYDIAPVNAARDSLMGNYVDYCRHRNYDGVLVMSVDCDGEELTELLNSDIPIVTIDTAHPNRNAVVSDNNAGTRALVRYVHRRGHRKIAFIHGSNTIVTEARLKGFHEECARQGVPVRQEYLRGVMYNSPEQTAQAVRALLALPEPPSCILCSDDYAGIGAINEVRAHGLRVPEDISIVGYDGIPLSQALSPRLTTLHQDIRGIGTHAAQMLLAAIEKPEQGTCQHLLLPGWIMEGESVKDLRAPAPSMEKNSGGKAVLDK